MSTLGKFDTIVVGAGVEGSATAYYLSKYGHKTLLLEQFHLPHTRGSSHGQSRIIRKAYPQEYYTIMMKEALDQWKNLEKEAGITLYKSIIVRNTGLMCFGTKDHTTVASKLESLKRNGEPYRHLTGAQVKKEFPAFDMPDHYSAVLDPVGGILLADKCIHTLQNLFKKHGGMIHDQTKVTGIIPGQTVTLVTNRGNYTANSVVITAGPWTSDLVKPLGLDLPLQAQRSPVHYWKELKYGSFSSSHNPCFSMAVNCKPGDVDLFGIPSHEYPGLVKICIHGGPCIHPDHRDSVVGEQTDKELKKLQEYVRNYFPGIEDIPSIEEACIYTMTPDEDFILDRHPTFRNIIVGAGFSGHGFKLAPVVGKVLGELATDQPPSYDLSPFRIDRFKKKAKL